MLRLFLLLLLASCGGGGDSPMNSSQAQTKKPLIYVFGDSITAGYMPGDGVRNHLRQDLSYANDLKTAGEVITAAVGGAETSAALTSQVYWLKPRAPDVVVIMLGTNDAAQVLSRLGALENVKGIADAWPGARLVLVSPPHWSAATDPWMSAWAADLKTLAGQRGAAFVDVYAASLTHPEWQCHPEDNHPCANAHREFAQMILKAIP